MKSAETGGKWGVVVVDVQGDFTEWKRGALAVPGSGRDYVEAVEKATRALREAGLLIVGSQDWHPPDHLSFVTTHPGKRPFETIVIDGRTQVLWPPHCVQGTENARIVIDNGLFDAIVRKAQDRAFDSYSAFQDDGGRKTGLDDILKANAVGRLLIYGLATDYCVRATVLDALRAGYRVALVRGLCRGITARASELAFDEMSSQGARIVDNLEEAGEEIGLKGHDGE